MATSSLACLAHIPRYMWTPDMDSGQSKTRVIVVSVLREWSIFRLPNNSHIYLSISQLSSSVVICICTYLDVSCQETGYILVRPSLTTHITNVHIRTHNDDIGVKFIDKV